MSQRSAVTAHSLTCTPHPPPPHTHTLARARFLLCSSQEFKTDLTWAPEALEALRCVSEDYIVALMEDASLEAIHARRSIVDHKDVQLRQRVRGRRG